MAAGGPTCSSVASVLCSFAFGRQQGNICRFCRFEVQCNREASFPFLCGVRCVKKEECRWKINLIRRLHSSDGASSLVLPFDSCSGSIPYVGLCACMAEGLLRRRDDIFVARSMSSFVTAWIHLASHKFIGAPPLCFALYVCGGGGGLARGFGRYSPALSLPALSSFLPPFLLSTYFLLPLD